MWNDLIPIIHSPDYILVSIVCLLIDLFIYLLSGIFNVICVCFSLTTVFPVSALRDFWGLSPRTYESYASSLFTLENNTEVLWTILEHFNTKAKSKD